MSVRQLEDTSRQLIAAGRQPDCPAALIENGTTSRQRIVRGTLKELPDLAKKHAVTTPALLLVGEVVRFNDKLDWFEAPSLNSDSKSDSGPPQSVEAIWTESANLNSGTRIA